MTMQMFCSMVGIFCCLSSNRMHGWIIEAIQNNLPYAVCIEFSKKTDPVFSFQQEILPGEKILFGIECPFCPNLKTAFKSFNDLSSALSIASVSDPDNKGFIAEGVYGPNRARGTVYLNPTTDHRNHMVGHTLGALKIRPNSFNIYATLLLSEDISRPNKNGRVRRMMLCSLKDIKFVREDGGFSKDINKMAQEHVTPKSLSRER